MGSVVAIEILVLKKLSINVAALVTLIHCDTDDVEMADAKQAKMDHLQLVYKIVVLVHVGRLIYLFNTEIGK